MISVIGGTYEEFCQFPPWRQTFGSAGRAVAVIATLGSPATLHTFSSPDGIGQRQALADVFGFTLAATGAAPNVAFDYFHALTPIEITPDSLPLYDPSRRLEVDCDLALRFGVIEGETIVRAERAVYDPQSPGSPVRYHNNGSTAAELALVCNLAEARALTGQLTAEDCASSLLTDDIEVAVIKAGPFGAFVATRSIREWIPAFQSDTVFPIGSGDVFSAVFAKSWLLDTMRPDDAACTASRATAVYCGSSTFPSTRQLAESALQLVPFTPARPVTRPPRVYLAGPFFTMHELWLVEEARAELTRMGMEIFSPFHEVGMTRTSKEIAQLDLAGLDNCDIVFALLDSVDAGTVFEIGYARKAGKPVIAFAQKVNHGDLTMIEGTDAIIESDFATAVYKAAWTGWATP